MSDLFEFSTLSAKRRATGATISIAVTQFDQSLESFVYENSTYGLRVGFPALYVAETFSLVLKSNDRLVEQPILVGVILAKGQLKIAVDRQLGPSALPGIADDVVRDIYELLPKLLRNDPIRKSYHFDIQPSVHIYEVEARRFADAINEGAADRPLDPAAISTFPATLVI